MKNPYEAPATSGPSLPRGRSWSPLGSPLLPLLVFSIVIVVWTLGAYLVTPRDVVMMPTYSQLRDGMDEPPDEWRMDMSYFWACVRTGLAFAAASAIGAFVLERVRFKGIRTRHDP